MTNNTQHTTKRIDEFSVRSKKRLGQYFLHDRAVLKKIVRACNIQTQDAVVEIGPGTGALTQYFIQYKNQIIGIEKDWRLCEELTKTFSSATNLTITNTDVLRWDACKKLGKKQYIVVGNIPYYITGKLLELILEHWPHPRTIVLMVQKEVAQRICAHPPHLSILGVMTQSLATPRILFFVPRTCFHPQPNVNSAIIELVPHALLQKTEQKSFKKLVMAGFSHPRKYCVSNLCEKVLISKHECALVFGQLHIPSTARAQELSLEVWMKLFALLKTKLS